MAGCVTAAAPAAVFAQTTPDPGKLKLAAEEFDAGRQAYKSGDYARAAAHFENAFRDAPSPQTLRMAIRARNKVGNEARAATLCVRALSLYPDDERTVRLARAVLKDTNQDLYKVTIACDPACTVLVDGRLVRDDAASRQVIYTSPGPHTLVAGWGKQRNQVKEVQAEPGGQTVLSFEAPPMPKPEPSPERTPSDPPEGPEGEEQGQVEVVSSGKASPTLFWLGAAVTTAFGGLTIWSGIDTLNNPGTDEVREACVGQGTSCEEYQDGVAKQNRTNYLMAGTAIGVASVTVIGLFFTDWGGDDPVADPGTNHVSVSPMVNPVAGGVGMAASARF